MRTLQRKTCHRPVRELWDWVIVGGESGPRARPVEASWAADIRNQCRRARVPFFFKQWGGANKKKAGRLLDGRTWSEMPRGVAVALAGRLGGPPADG